MPRRKPSSAEERRSLRTKLAKLKKAGVLSPKFNVRGAKPSAKNYRIVNEYKGIIEGRQKTVKLPKAKVLANKEDGLATVRDRVIIETTPDSKVRYLKNDPYGFKVEHTTSSGIRAIEFHGGKNAILKYAQYADDQIRKGNAVAFTVDGYRSHHVYRDVVSAVNAFEKYRNKNEVKTFTIYEVPRSMINKWRPTHLSQIRGPRRRRAQEKQKKKR